MNKSDRPNRLIENFAGIFILCGCIWMLIADYGITGTDWWTFLTFTFISNFTAATTFILRWIKVVDRNSYKQKVWQCAITANLTMVIVVYWALLSKEIDWSGSLATIFSTFWVHLLNPLVVLFVFVWQAKYMHGFRVVWPHLFVSTALPLAWLLMEQIFFYTANISFYSFLSTENQSLLMVYVFVLGITIFTIGFGALFVWLNNVIRKHRKYSKKQLIL